MEFTEGICDKTLINIEDGCLAIANKVLSQLGIPPPTRAATGSFDVHLSRKHNYITGDLQSNIPKLTLEQKGIYDRTMHMINDGIGGPSS